MINYRSVVSLVLDTLYFWLLTSLTLECRFTSEHANVVHMTIKPQDMVDDEEASKSKAPGRERENGDGPSRCHCVIL